MSPSGQLLTMLRAIHDLSEGKEGGVGYAQISAATGMCHYLLLGKAYHLKARGLIERANPDAPRCDAAFFVPTPKGRAVLVAPAPECEPIETSVQRAIRVRPALATVWAGA